MKHKSLANARFPSVQDEDAGNATCEKRFRTVCNPDF